MITLDKPRKITCSFCGANLNLTSTRLFSDARLIGKNEWACFYCYKENDIKKEHHLINKDRYK